MRARPIPKKTIEALRKRSGNRCEARLPGICCGYPISAHHKKFRSRGGSNDLVNLACLCHRCHRAAHDEKPGTRKWRTSSWQEEGEWEVD